MMVDILIRGGKKPKSCFTHGGRECDYHQVAWDGSYHRCFITKTECKCNRLNKDCPISEVREIKVGEYDKLRMLYVTGKKIYIEVNDG